LATLAGLALVMALLWLFAAPQTQAVMYALCVNHTGTGCDAAVCLTHCYSSVQAAVNAVAYDGEQILVAEGVYANGGTLAVITKPVVIIGGYSDDLSLHEPSTRTTTLDGQSGGSVIHISEAGEVILQHLNIIQGDGKGNNCYGAGVGGCGGGVYAYSTTVGVQHCTFVSNVGSDVGSGKGGGMYLFSAVGSPWTAYVEHSVFEGNIASTDGAGDGGGLWLHTANPAEPAMVIDSLFLLNRGSIITKGLGGGVFLYHYATFRDNTFQENAGSTAPGGPGSGGGLYMWYAPGVNLERNRFVGNMASQSGPGAGGAIQAYSLGAFTMTNNLLAGNQADGKGSGIYLDGWKADRGIVATLINNTLAGNTGSGGGIYVAYHTNLTLLNNIIAGHTLGITNTVPANSVIDARANLLWNDTDPIVGTSAVLADPLLLPDYHLDSGSPAINRGLPTWVPADIDGDPRPESCHYDIGFDEFILGLGGCHYTYLPLTMRSY
jgi:hypothetical protein